MFVFIGHTTDLFTDFCFSNLFANFLLNIYHNSAHTFSPLMVFYHVLAGAQGHCGKEESFAKHLHQSYDRTSIQWNTYNCIFWSLVKIFVLSGRSIKQSLKTLPLNFRKISVPSVQTAPCKLQKFGLVLKQAMLRGHIATSMADFFAVAHLDLYTHIPDSCCNGLLIFSTLSPSLKVLLDSAVSQRFRLWSKNTLNTYVFVSHSLQGITQMKIKASIICARITRLQSFLLIEIKNVLEKPQ